METEREYLLGKADKVAIAQLYADGFEKLSTEDKILAYYLYQSAAAGGDIAYHQNRRHGLAIRSILEAMITHFPGTNQAIMKQQFKYSGKI